MATKKADLKENGDPKRTKLPQGHVTKAKELHNIRYAFSKEELAEKSKRMANAVADKNHHDDELKTIKSEFKAKIDAQDAVINQMSQHITSGYESRNVECEVTKDFEKGTKTYSFNGVDYDTVPLTQSDRQTELGLINRSPAASEQDSEAIDQEIDAEKQEENVPEED